jgi:hypothetical protein
MEKSQIFLNTLLASLGDFGKKRDFNLRKFGKTNNKKTRDG